MDSADDSADITLSLLMERNSETSNGVNMREKTSGDKVRKISRKQEEGEEWMKERNVFELQLNQLQEQLVAAMVQNQQLGETFYFIFSLFFREIYLVYCFL